MQAYYLRDSMLDPVEQSLYRALTVVLCQRALLFTKIQVGDLFRTSPCEQNSCEWESLSQQQIDFLLCDRDSMRPLGAILFAADAACAEQSDGSLQIAQVCAAAGLPVVHLQRQPTYFMHQLTPVVEALLTPSAHRNDFTNGDRLVTPPGSTGAKKSVPHPGAGPRRKLPAYPGYGALKTIANKLA